MQSKTPTKAIDLLDTKVLLTTAYDAETKFLEAASMISFYDQKEKTTIYVKHIVWMIRNA